MKLKHIFSLLAISGLTIITIAFFLSTKTVENEIVEANVSRQASNVKIVSATLEHASELQKLFLRDYSFWDDMAEAVQKKDTSWLEQEFFGPLEIYSADAVWVVAPEGKLLYTNRSTNSTLSLDELAIPFDLTSIGTHAHQEEISTFFKQDPQTKAVVAYHVGPILYHSQPEKNTKPYGFIIVAVHWNAALLQQLSTLVDATVTIKPANNKDSAYKVQALTQQLRNHEGATIATLEFLFSDTSLLFLSQHFEREMRQMGLLGIMSIIITFIVFQTAIIQPINKLIIQLKTVSHSKQSKEMEKKSELTLLSELIEKYGKQIEKISNKNNQLKEADKTLQDLVDNLQISESQTKRQLRTSLKLAKAVDAATDAIVITDTNGCIEYVNKAWEVLNGYAQSEVLGKKPSILKSGRTNSTTYKKLWTHITKGETFSCEEVINKKKDGSLYAARVNIFPVIENKQITNYVGMVQDISERKQKEHLRSEFVSLASHQLRTPLTSLRWLSEMLRKRAKNILGSTELDILKNIEVSAIRMTALVNRLLNLSRIETGRLSIKPQRVHLEALIRDVKKNIQPMISSKKQTIHIHLDSNLPVISVDIELLHEVLINVLANAAKYTPQKGSITLEVRKHSDMVSFSVTDTGIGIPVSEQKHIFERFFRASNAVAVDQQGTGLGLYLVKIVVESLGGEVDLFSEEGKGTKVSFNIPKIGSQKQGEVAVIKSKV